MYGCLACLSSECDAQPEDGCLKLLEDLPSMDDLSFHYYVTNFDGTMHLNGCIGTVTLTVLLSARDDDTLCHQRLLLET